jgi:dehydrodolichyl diphosphate syntase complex subunit NUS1
MVGREQSHALKTDSDQFGRPLNSQNRERILKPYLPTKTTSHQAEHLHNGRSNRFQHKRRVRPAIRHLIHSLIFAIIHTFFSVYIRARQSYHAIVDQALAIIYYHHRTPELIKRDVKNLSKVPKHLSVILTLPPEGGKKDRLETLVNDVCEVAAWSASAGIPYLSIYERSGILKHSLPHLHRRISRTMIQYYGATSSSKPTISLRAPHLPSYSPPTTPTTPTATNGDSVDSTAIPPHLTILLLSHADGRQTLVDLTKTLAEMSQSNKLAPSDISSELIDAEITESVMGEPDLLILFGDKIVLEGYPPWQARLTEIFYVQDRVAEGVGYHVFLRALSKYGKAEFRVGT